MKVAFICRDIDYYSYPLIARHLKENFRAETYAITLSTVTASIIEEHYPGSFDKILSVDEFFGENNDFRDLPINEKVEYLKATEEKLGIPSIYSLIYVDRVIVNNKYEDLITIAYGIIKFVDSYMAYDTDLIIGEIGTFLENILMRFYSMRGSHYVTLTSARIQGKCFFTNGLMGEGVGLRENYEKYKDRSLTAENERMFDEFYRDFMGGRKRPDYMKSTTLPLKIKNIVAAHLERARYKNKSNYILEGIDRSGIKELAMLRINKAAVKSIYRLLGLFSSLPSRKYIFFPLHLDPEIATLMYAPYYVNQLSVIENIAKSIPADCILAVKEHPVMYGMRPISFYRKIRRLPNVVLLDPRIDSYRVIENAEALVVLTGTAGFEAIMYEKPVFILGNVFYSIYKLAYTVDNVKGLPEKIKSGLSRFTKNRDELKRFILALHGCSYDGVIGNPIEDRTLLYDKNIANLARAIFSAYNSHVKND